MITKEINLVGICLDAESFQNHKSRKARGSGAEVVLPHMESTLIAARCFLIRDIWEAEERPLLMRVPFVSARLITHFLGLYRELRQRRGSASCPVFVMSWLS